MFLFQFFVGDFKFDVLLRAQRDCTDPLTCPDSTLTTYSIVVLVIYAVLGTILMANLLIAILTYKYDPATIDAESTFQRSQTLQTYQAQVGAPRPARQCPGPCQHMPTPTMILVSMPMLMFLC
mmetsp:Transcript_38259/g.97789  ORF Transcript_38259/g.97789 Transcript_38259/m.97789 type:complete len:123 (+) Transcript_38259:145-513(+)